MARRQQLHDRLAAMTANVYFQPPDNLTMQYPCIRYQRDNADTEFADNVPYSVTEKYMVTIIDRNPDSDIRPQVAALPTCVHNRFYVVGNLNHDVYTLHF